MGRISQKSWLIAFFIVLSVVAYSSVMAHFYSKERIAIERKIDFSEDYGEEIKALALSMPLLPDSIVSVIADSLLFVIVDLNKDWVIYVLSDERFEGLTDDMEKLNRELDGYRVLFEIEKELRKHRNVMKDEYNLNSKKETFVSL